MRKLVKSDIIANEEYEKVRPDMRQEIMAAKEPRRIIIEPYLTFLFENRETMRYQVQEMMRAEGIHDEDAIEHEIQTYNMLIPGENELTATMMLEIDEPAVRSVKLKELVGIDKHVFIELDDGHKIPALFDESQLDPEKVSSVQYIRFELGADGSRGMQSTKKAEIVIDHPGCNFRQVLQPEQLAALRADLIAE